MTVDIYEVLEEYRFAIKILKPAKQARLTEALLDFLCTGENEPLRGQEAVLFPLFAEKIDRLKTAKFEKSLKMSQNAKMRLKTGNAELYDFPKV